MVVVAVVPAAGRGERLGAALPKALYPLRGTPLVAHAVHALATSRSVTAVVVAAPPEHLDDVRRIVPTATVVAGGSTRSESVRAALAVLAADVEIVLVHDAARPLAPPALVDAVAAAVGAGAPAVVPGLPVADTVKRIDASGRVQETVDRTWLRAVQTPQGFARDVLVRAHADGADDATDDAALAERVGVPVLVLPGHPEAFKITSLIDLVLAETVLARRERDAG